MARLVLFNKPFRVLSQFTSADGKATLADFIDLPKVYPAGRLDYDSEGLLLLTDNGRLQHRLAHPTQKLAKHYWAQVEGEPQAADMQALVDGVALKDGPAAALTAHCIAPPALWPRHPPIRERRDIPANWIALVIDEGRNRQVRRMTAAIGFPTLRLVRHRIGNWTLGDLQPGEQQTAQVADP